MNSAEAVDATKLFEARGAATLRLPIGAMWQLGSAPVRYLCRGAIDVFAATRRDDGGNSPLMPIGRLGSGVALFVEPGLLVDVDLFCVCAQDCEFREIPMATLSEGLGDADRSQLAAMLDQWITAATSQLVTTPSVGRRYIDPGDGVAVKAGHVIASDGVVWIHDPDCLLEYPAENAIAFSAGPYQSLLTASLEARVKKRGNIDCHDTQAAMSDSVAKTFRQWGECLRALAIKRLDAWTRDAAARHARRATGDQLAMRDGVAAIVSVAETETFTQRLRDPTQNSLEVAMQLIGQHMGVDVSRTPIGRPFLNDEARLNWMTQRARLRRRLVSLQSEAWQDDGIPMLVSMTGDDSLRVALCNDRGQWTLTDPTNGQVEPLTPDRAEDLGAWAMTFYRALPDQLTVKELIRFVASNIARDAQTLVVVSVLAVALTLALPFGLKFIVDSSIPSANLGDLSVTILTLLTLTLAIYAFHMCRALALVRIEGRSTIDIQAGFWDRLLRLPLPFFRKYAAGDLAARVSEIGRIYKLLFSAVSGMFLGGLTICLSLAVMIYFMPAMGVVVAAAGLVFLSLFAVSENRRLGHLRREAARQGRLTGAVVQLLGGIAKLRAAAAEARAFRFWAEGYSERGKMQRAANRRADQAFLASDLLYLLVLVLVFAAIGMQEHANIGDFLAFNTALVQFVAAIMLMVSSTSSGVAALPLAERLMPLIEARPESVASGAESRRLAGRLDIEAVSFRYGPTSPLVLDDLSMTIEPGEFVAIVGGSGSGKSTLFRIILGFETPTRGAAYFDGQDLRQMDQTAVRRQFGVVMQNSRLTTGSILDNVLGSSGLGQAEALTAIRMAGLQDDIAALPMGLQTYISETSGGFSGGQAQRLMIARALVGHPRFLLFDEATSALDNRSQAIVSKNIKKMDVTRIVIAHRLSTIRDADRIYVLDKGRIVQQGRFENLMQQDGVFRTLAERQMA
ncbi:MAG: NHLP bacteriocin export ABC transporter permease/ATPase subunit [Hyphomicrobiaceae bacterium]